MDKNEIEALEAKACEIRCKTIEVIGHLGVGHIGGAMSVIEILTVLYYRQMDVTPDNPGRKDRDRLVLSKGHAGPALYSILADKGYFPEEWLHTLNHCGTRLPSHCDMNRTPGIDMTTGSLGQGISAAVGMALANRLDGVEKDVFLIIGDGETDEGQIWEGAMSAAQFGLGHLIAFTDFNKLQLDGSVEEVMGIEDLSSKWKSFGWHVQRVDGHDVAALSDAVDNARNIKDKPSMIIADTVKGKGASFAEGRLDSHNMTFSYEIAKDAINMLKQK